MKNIRTLRRIARLYRFVLSFYKPRVYKTVFALCFLISLIACTEDSKNETSTSSDPSTPQDIKVTENKSETSKDGRTSVKFKLNEADISAIQLVAESQDSQIRIISLTAPDGNELFDVKNLFDEKITASTNFQNSPLTFNYPILSSQDKLTRGEYLAIYETRDPSTRALKDSKISLDVISKKDSDLQSGILNVNIILGGIASNDKNIRDGVESALGIMNTMLQRFSLNVFTSLFELPQLPDTLPNPQTGDVLYEEMSKSVDKGINLYISNNANFSTGRPYDSVLSGSTPGAITPTRRSAVVINLSIATGSDGQFDAKGYDTDSINDSEVRLLAESMTQGVLSYLGLQDTVTFGSSQVTDSDGLNSQKCSNMQSCQDSKGANGNLLFPYPLQEDGNASGQKYYPRDRLSSQQIEIIQRYVGVE